MLERAEDPTFLLLIFIWQAAYAWDEALQQLSEYVVQLVRFFSLALWNSDQTLYELGS